MRVESIHYVDGLLNVRCTGTIGIGTESTVSMRPVGDAVAGWLREHRDEAVREIEVDFREVDYRWGDAPVACFIPFLRDGVQAVRFLAGASSAPALESLIAVARLPWFSVQRVDA